VWRGGDHLLPWWNVSARIRLRGSHDRRGWRWRSWWGWSARTLRAMRRCGWSLLWQRPLQREPDLQHGSRHSALHV